MLRGLPKASYSRENLFAKRSQLQCSLFAVPSPTGSMHAYYQHPSPAVAASPYASYYPSPASSPSSYHASSSLHGNNHGNQPLLLQHTHLRPPPPASLGYASSPLSRGDPALSDPRVHRRTTTAPLRIDRGDRTSLNRRACQKLLLVGTRWSRDVLTATIWKWRTATVHQVRGQRGCVDVTVAVRAVLS